MTISSGSDGFVRCSFCAKRQDEVKKIVAGPEVYICDECVELCALIISADLGGGPGDAATDWRVGEASRG